MSKLVDQIWIKQNEFLKQFDTIKVPRGGLDKHGAEALEWLFNKVKRKGIKVAEIGCWTGTSSVILGNLVKKYKGKLYCIDWFQGSKDANLDCAKFIDIESIFTENVKQSELAKYVYLVKGSSTSTHGIPKESFDLIFIDGDHRYEYVKKDIQIWKEMLKPGGIICGHDCEYLIKGYDDLFKQTELVDYTQCHTGVIRAVYEIFGNKANLTNKGYIWWVQKDKNV